MIRRSLLCVFAACCAAAVGNATVGNAADGVRRDYAFFLREIRDLDRLPYLDEGAITRQFSSYHRASHYDRAMK